MLDKIKNVQYKEKFKALSDVRVLGLVVFAVLVVLVSWSGTKVIQTNYELQKEISKLQQENSVHELENENLKLKNQYLNTDQFLELAARRQFGRGAPGEKLVIVPKEMALKYTVDIPQPAPEALETDIPKSQRERNLEAWTNFFFHR